MFKVRFSNFWPAFDPQNNFFLSLIKDILREDVMVTMNPSDHVDLSFSSVFTKEYLNWRRPISYFFSPQNKVKFMEAREARFDSKIGKFAKRTVWYTGENIKPPLHVYDLTLSHETTCLNAQNLYFPHWMYRIDWGFGNKDATAGLTPDFLYKKRLLSSGVSGACSYYSYTNRSRDLLHIAVSTCMRVDRFGSSVNKTIPDKITHARQYLFQICPENNLYPGYVTEKVFEAWMSGNIPIWQGIDSADMLNKDAIIDVTWNSVEQVIETLKSLDFGIIQNMRQLPILRQLPTLDNLRKELEILIG